MIFGVAEVCDDAKVFGDAIVYGNAAVYGDAGSTIKLRSGAMLRSAIMLKFLVLPRSTVMSRSHVDAFWEKLINFLRKYMKPMAATNTQISTWQRQRLQKSKFLIKKHNGKIKVKE